MQTDMPEMTEMELEAIRLRRETAQLELEQARSRERFAEIDKDTAKAKAAQEANKTTRAGYWASAFATVLVVATLTGGTYWLVRVNNENNTERITACVTSGGQWKQNPYTTDFECLRGTSVGG